MPTAAGNVRREHVEAFIEDQLTRWTPSTAASRYRYLQQFFRCLEQEGHPDVADGPHEAAIGSRRRTWSVTDRSE